VTEKKRLLIVDDEAAMRRILQVAFEKAGYQTVVAESGPQALQFLSDQPFDCVLTDVTMPGMTGYQLQVQIAQEFPQIPVVIMTAYGTIPEAISAIRRGAFEFVPKPFDLENLKKIIKAAVQEGAQVATPKTSKKASSKGDFIAESPAMKSVLETVDQVADSKATVLITGESGTGKEVVAKRLHQISGRKNEAFIATSCAAIPETLLESELFGYEKGAFTGAQGSKAGRFELAQKGTLFLDEIGEVPLPIQAKLLRVLQEREFERLGATKSTQIDVRLITATNRDLEREVEVGTFRLDLLYRLQVIEIHLPPLRERPEDILPLSQHFVAKFSAENGRPALQIGPDFEQALLAYAWPGNVRELSNAIERSVVLTAPTADQLSVKGLPKSLHAA